MKGRRRGVREWHNSVFLLESRDRIHPQFVNYQAWIRIEERRLPAKLAWTYRQLGLITSLMNGSIERWAKEESSVEIAKSSEHGERRGGGRIFKSVLRLCQMRTIAIDERSCTSVQANKGGCHDRNVQSWLN